MQHFVHGQCLVNLYVLVCSFVNVEKKKECIHFKKKILTALGLRCGSWTSLVLAHRLQSAGA